MYVPGQPQISTAYKIAIILFISRHYHYHFILYELVALLFNC